MATGIGRRRFLFTLGGAALGLPFAARAQHTSKISKIGFLYPGVSAVLVPRIGALREGLRAINYEDADRMKILARSFEGDPAMRADAVIE